MKNSLSRFHDSAYNQQVAEAHDFVTGALGFDVVRPNRVVVVPGDKERAAELKRGRPLAAGQYDQRSRDVVVLAEKHESPDSLVKTIVHELMHDATMFTRQARGAHLFLLEALAGMAEARYMDELVLRGRRSILAPTVTNYESVPFLSLYLPGRYVWRDLGGMKEFSAGLAAAAAMSVVSQVSGIHEQDILSAASGWRGRHINLMERSLGALGVTVSDLDGYPRNAEGVIWAAGDIGAKAVRCGAVMDNHQKLEAVFPHRQHVGSAVR